MRYFQQNVFLQYLNGDRSGYIPPCGSYSVDFSVPEHDFPVSHSIRLVGETAYFWKWRSENGSSYAFAMSIDDALSKKDTFGETYALSFECKQERYERNAWLKLYQQDFPEKSEYRFVFPAKVKDLQYGEGGYIAAELEIYRKKSGRHPNDVFDTPDEIRRITLPEGTFDWQEFELTFPMPEDAVCILVHIGMKNVSGSVLLGSPRLYPAGNDNILPPFDRTQARDPHYNYLAENMSRRDWIEFELFIDGKSVFCGEKYTSIFRRPDFELEAGVLAPGKHTMTIQFHNEYDSAVGFMLQQLDLLEYGNHPFELIAAPEFLKKDDPCRVLIKTSVDQLTLESCGKLHNFKGKGLHVLHLPPLSSAEQTYVVEGAGFRDSFLVKECKNSTEKLYLSTGDSIFIRQTPEDMLRFLEWYLSNHIGNAICFRHSYRWGGGRFMDEKIWEKVLPLLQELGIFYSVMVDGRELPGKNANPPERLLQSPYYLGRQAHENDGAFNYWNNTLWKPEPLPEPYADILSRSMDKGGIQPAVRPKRNGDHAWWFFDPTAAENMKEAAEAFVCNLMDAKGESIRHSGPSTHFRYFFQAGYQFLISEQMYGPEEIVLASLRGASRAYGVDGFGAHLATQWSSTPHDTPEHAERYFLSLATCYLQGVTQINTEEGLYRMENGFVDHDRFSRNCLTHLDAHTRFRRFMQTHPREGELVTPIACVQGRYDGWNCFGRGGNVWKREGKQWEEGDAELSFDLLNIFYPRSRMSSIYCCPCPVKPQGWYSGTPYGPVDLVPFEGDWKKYKAVVFLGWHSYLKEDGKKLLEYVSNGGTLLLSKRHLSMNLEHDGTACYETDPALDALLGKSWLDSTGILRRKVGTGCVIFFGDDFYPYNAAVRSAYETEIRTIAESVVEAEKENGWVSGNEDVNFAVYERPDGFRDIYLLNIRWWDRNSSTVTVHRQGIATETEIPEGVIEVR